jgi:hypothetical protein
MGEPADTDAASTAGNTNCSEVLRLRVKFKDQDDRKPFALPQLNPHFPAVERLLIGGRFVTQVEKIDMSWRSPGLHRE